MNRPCSGGVRMIADGIPKTPDHWPVEIRGHDFLTAELIEFCCCRRTRRDAVDQ
jgi:hypothetical protein